MRFLPIVALLAACVSSGVLATEKVAFGRSASMVVGCNSPATGGCEERRLFYLSSATGKECRVSEKEYQIAKRDSVFTCRWKWAE